MRTRLYCFLALALSISLSAPQLTAQNLEIGIKAGGALYSGDLSPGEFGLYFEDLNFAGGLYLRYRPTTRFGIRVNGNFGRLSAEGESMAPNENGDRVNISRNFRTKLTEFNAVLEYDLFYLGDRDRNFFAPYAYAGIGVLSFNPESEIDGVYTELQPLRTEAQGQDPTRYDITPYELTKAVFVFGGGVRVRFADRIVLGLEIGGRNTFTDYIDDITNRPVNYLDVISGPGGTLAGQFSNPAVTNPAEVTDLEYRRGGEFNDFYFVGGLTLGITIGQGGSNKSGCYKF